uniref:Sulfotransferase n=1 Tax=Varanus komodoensis TaxID=61221 RepID=A0A8D2IQZ0_VARKO
MEALDPKDTKRCTLEEVQGVPLFPDLVEQWDSLWNFKARPDDLLICTYPKAGTTWMQEIVDMIQQGGDVQKCARAPIYERIPFIEMCFIKLLPTGFEMVEAMPSPRTLKSHFPVHLLPPSFWEQNCKIIYVARNAKDVAVSYFHFHRMGKLFPEPGNWDEFLEKFIAGKVAWGSWSDHILNWWKAKDHHPILYLFYEDMKEEAQLPWNPWQAFLEVALFLPEPILNRIVQHTQFESMKANPMCNLSTMPPELVDPNMPPFMRKGKVEEEHKARTAASIPGRASQTSYGVLVAG